MSLEQQIRDALLQLASSLQQDISGRATAIAKDVAGAAERDRAAAEARAASELAEQIAAVRAEADRRVGAEGARVRGELEAANADELGKLRAEIERLRDEAETAAAELALVRDRALAAEQTVEKAREAETAARAQERHDEMATLDRLIGAVRRIGEAAALSDVLAALADAVGAETSRTGVFVGAGASFQPFRLHGFSEPEGRPISRSEAANLTRGLPFAPLPADRAGFSVPIDISGQTVAIVYADDVSANPAAVPSPWPEAIEILARHAALRLETLTALRTVQALGAGRPATGSAPVATLGTGATSTEDDQSARRYARLLVSEIKLYNEASVRLGRQKHDLLTRLRPEIDRARRLYEERVPAHVPSRATYFDDELVQTLADGDPALLGRG